jgi:hypothetical protein
MSSGGGGGGQNTQSTVQTVKIPDYLQDASLKAVQASQDLASQPYQQYTGQTIAGLTPQQTQAIDIGTANATNPTYGQIAGDATTKTMNVPGMVDPTFNAAANQALSAAPNAQGYYNVAGGSAANVPGSVAPLYGAAAGTAASVPGATAPLYGAAAGTAASVPGSVNPIYGAGENQIASSPGSVAPLYGLAADTAANVPGSVNLLYNMGAGTVASASSPQGLVDNSAAVNPGDIPSWMSPYIDQALAPQLRAIARQGVTTQQGIDRTATGAGAFGDARTGIQSGVNDRNVMEATSNAVGTGYQNAYQSAVQAAQTAAAQRQGLTGQRLTANQQQTQAGTALANIASAQGSTATNVADLLQRIATGQGGLGVSAGQALTQAASAQGATGTNVADLLQRIASGMGSTDTNAAQILAQIASSQGATGISAADLLRQIGSTQESGQSNAAQVASQIAAQTGTTNLAAAQQEGATAAQQYALQQQQAQDLMGYGKTQQDQTQASLSQAYQDFVNQREAPKENLNLLLAAIQGVPYATTRLTTTPYNATAANLGAITSLLGLGGKLSSPTTA